MGRRLFITAGLTLAFLATQGTAQVIPPVSEMRAKVDGFVAKSYPVADIVRQVHVEYADINSDGAPEVFVIVSDQKACGPNPCALILDLTGDAAQEIAALAGTELRALQTKSGRWRDVMLDGKRLRWQDGSYQ